ncbi:AEC family transporter [Celeribacter ethanolicus]|uniref:Transporter n=1 Tax=Celeribacter ethanolicus TaxID=1758178 RepID=A0A291GE08_9RHOB|nr:AEC family transporter [Celeribacter ethanolicus]ATG48300.1 transporter [Celeribacter ethanolicus]TNE64521.1 MAG: transporter [Paracoccaceae bacterium]
MAEILTIFGITFPIFAMVAIGYATVTKGVFRPQDMSILGGWVMNFALPALVFGAISSRPISEVIHPDYIVVYALSGLLTAGLTFLWFSIVADPGRRGVVTMISYCPNSGFIGYPMFLILVPDHAGIILAMNFLVENIVFIPLALMAIEAGKPREDRRGNALQQFGQVLKSLLKRPLIIAIILGFLISASGLSLPGPVHKLIDLVAASASAVALFVIGGSLVGLSFEGNLRLAGQAAVGKLIVMPVCTALVIFFIGHFGVTMDSNLRTAALISAALPTMAIAALFAQEVGRGALASLSILVNTLGAFVTLNIVLFLVV